MGLLGYRLVSVQKTRYSHCNRLRGRGEKFFAFYFFSPDIGCRQYARVRVDAFAAVSLVKAPLAG
jgi:hypothetical protein